ncbi:MAG TPA: alpha/beta hydrolase [Verrucomicrobiae bacterium]|nr:alpha/beta hydrolase [Verrucomicrobiae bacterium]
MIAIPKRFLLLAPLFVVLIPCAASEPAKVIRLWPATAPGDTGNLGEEHDTTKPGDGLVAGKQVIRLGNVSVPTIAVYPAPADKQTGTAVVVCPGGGYSILAMDLEGTEVCDWLNSIGVTAILLKYRVPKRPGLEKHTAAVQDAQRALGLVRHQATTWGIDPHRIGVLGFSAGGHLAALVGCQYAQRTYPAVDDADATSCRPDFTLLIYPGYLTVKDQDDRVAPELTLNGNTPPAFLVMAADDPVRVENVLFYAAALRKARVPFELHVYPTGGHGYGLRSTKNLVTTWPQRATDWMRSRGLLGEGK